MRMKKWHIAAFILLAVIVVRIVYVNIVYDKPVSISNKIGETFTYGDNLEIKVNNMEAFTKEEWSEELKKANIDNGDLNYDYIAVLVEFTVTNTSQEEVEFDRTDVYAEIGTASNGMSLGLSNRINGDNDISSTYEPGQTKNIKQVYIIDAVYLNKEKIMSQKIKVKVCEYSAIHTITK